MSTPTGTARHPEIDATGPLRGILRIDGWSTAVLGVVMLAAAQPLSGSLGLPTGWSIPFGVAIRTPAAAGEVTAATA